MAAGTLMAARRAHSTAFDRGREAYLADEWILGSSGYVEALRASL
jgi:hypothetical protein